MRDEIILKINSRSDSGLVFTTFDYLKNRLAISALDNLGKALEQLVDNVLKHAFEQSSEISLQVNYYISNCQFKIEVEDGGVPFDFSKYLSEPIDHSADHSKGFRRIYDLVDRFYYTSLPNKGKRFTLIQTFDRCYDVKSSRFVPEEINRENVLKHLVIRSFIAGDGDGIAKLIYRNYDYTYYKNLFYEPHEVRKANERGDVHSIIALYNNEIIGHFALVRTPFSNVAEIAVATVDPRFKGMGIMNRMFDFLILEAKRYDFDAIYGEAIMLHPYSQKANLTHGMTESAIILGHVPMQMEIEHSIKNPLRSGSMVAFLLFKKERYPIMHSHIYGEQIAKVYEQAGVTIVDKTPKHLVHDAITYKVDEKLKVGLIRIDSFVTENSVVEALVELLKEHCDMIYADINLHRIKNIDVVIMELNDHGFFYSGVLFAYYNNEDYLRLQRKNSKYIAEEQLACYSTNAKAMLDFIKEDEKRIGRPG